MPIPSLVYSKTCVRQPPLKLTLVVDVERWLSYEDTCHVILLAKLHDMYLNKTDNFFHINLYFMLVSKVALLHRFYCNAFISSFLCHMDCNIVHIDFRKPTYSWPEDQSHMLTALVLNCVFNDLIKDHKVVLIHLCWVHSSTSTFWTCPFPVEGVSGYFLLLTSFIEFRVFIANSVDPDQTPLGLHCLPIILILYVKHKWILGHSRTL